MNTSESTIYFKMSVLSILLLAALSGRALAEMNDNVPKENRASVVFNPAFLRGVNSNDMDLSIFESGSGIPPGDYDTDVYLNGVFLQNMKVTFTKDISSGRVKSCLPYNFYIDAGVKNEELLVPAVMKCSYVGTAVHGATEELNSSGMRLDISVPQASMHRSVKGYVPPSAWDEGVTAAYINYSGSYYNNSYENTNGSMQSGFMSFRSGVNLGLWQLRNTSSLRYSRNSGTNYTQGNSYLQRVFPELRSTLLVGESSTSGALFDSVEFRGVRLSSDDRMLSPNQQGYAPVVKGNAASNARVVIRQGNAVVYETTVPPGNFVIDDLYPTRNAGDLSVQVTESDGQVHSFTVPFSAVSASLRPGLSRYSVTAGKTQVSYLNADNSDFIEATYERGMTNQLTLNGGVIAAGNKYHSLAAGGVLATSAGAFGVNASYAHADMGEQHSRTGWQFKGSYNATYDPIGISLMLAAYRYSTSGFISLRDSLANGKTPYYYIDDTSTYQRSDTFQQKNRFETTINQTVGSYGSVFLSAVRQNYYGDYRKDTQYQAGFSSTLGRVSYSIGAGHQTTNNSSSGSGKSQNFITLSLSVPLDNLNTGLGNLNTTFSNYSGDGSQLQSGVNGSFGDNRQYSYNVNYSHDSRNNVNRAGVNLSEDTSFGNFGVGYSKSSDSSILSSTARGAIVAYSGGVLAGPAVGDTFGIVEAPEASGVRLSSAVGVTLNASGKAIMPSLAPYRYNLVTLDPTSIDSKVELEQTQKRTAPYAGAIPRIQFTTRSGYPLLINITSGHERTVPIGAVVTDKKGNEVGIVGQGGQAYVRVTDVSSDLGIVWGNGNSSKCRLHYDVSALDLTSPLILTGGTCQWE